MCSVQRDYDQRNYIANLRQMPCFRCVSLLHWVQEVMNIEDAIVLYSILVRVWACRNTFTNGSWYCVHKGDVNDATCFNTYSIKSIAMYCTVVSRASFPKGAATRYDSPPRSLPIALYMGQSQCVTCRSNVPDTWKSGEKELQLVLCSSRFCRTSCGSTQSERGRI